MLARAIACRGARTGTWPAAHAGGQVLGEQGAHGGARGGDVDDAVPEARQRQHQAGDVAEGEGRVGGRVREGVDAVDRGGDLWVRRSVTVIRGRLSARLRGTAYPGDEHGQEEEDAALGVAPRRRVGLHGLVALPQRRHHGARRARARRVAVLDGHAVRREGAGGALARRAVDGVVAVGREEARGAGVGAAELGDLRGHADAATVPVGGAAGRRPRAEAGARGPAGRVGRAALRAVRAQVAEGAQLAPLAEDLAPGQDVDGEGGHHAQPADEVAGDDAPDFPLLGPPCQLIGSRRHGRGGLPSCGRTLKDEAQ